MQAENEVLVSDLEVVNQTLKELHLDSNYIDDNYPIASELFNQIKFYKKISAKDLEIKIKALLADYEECSEENFPIKLIKLEQPLKEICFYFDNPIRVTDARNLLALRIKYDKFLFSISFFLNKNLSHRKLTEQESEKIVKGMALFIQKIKVRKAYRDLGKGKKFKKSSLIPANMSKDVNPIQELSKKNVSSLINRLKHSSQTQNKYGLLPDEVDLFAQLLELPIKLQHATNFYEPIASLGSLDSYAEIQRRDPNYESDFSTKGNIEKLCNGGFIFFRVYVEGINGEETRYGETKLIFDLDTVMQHGWVSLHDQLNPFSTTGSTRMYHKKRLLRMAETININNTAKTDKTLRDGMKYIYRVDPIKSFASGKPDTQKSFGKTIKTSTRIASFMDEVFYGKDIHVGIALSVIFELRQLHECGFRKAFLNALSKDNPAEKINRLGGLLKDFFRVEAKYPVALRFESANDDFSGNFSHIGLPAGHGQAPKEFKVINPVGDGRYEKGLHVNPYKMHMALLKNESTRLERNLSNVRRQLKKAENNYWSTEKLDIELRQLKNREAQIQAELQRMETEVMRLRGIPHDLHACILDLIRSQIATLDEFSSLSINMLRIFNKENIFELLKDDYVLFEDLILFNENDLQNLAAYDLKQAMSEYGYDLQQLIDLYNEDSRHLEYLCCDDLADLVLESAPDVDSLLMEYANEADVDFCWILGELCESDAISFQITIDNYFGTNNSDLDDMPDEDYDDYPDDISDESFDDTANDSEEESENTFGF